MDFESKAGAFPRDLGDLEWDRPPTPRIVPKGLVCAWSLASGALISVAMVPLVLAVGTGTDAAGQPATLTLAVALVAACCAHAWWTGRRRARIGAGVLSMVIGAGALRYALSVLEVGSFQSSMLWLAALLLVIAGATATALSVRLPGRPCL